MTFLERIAVRQANIDAVPGWVSYHEVYEAAAEFLPDGFKAIELGVTFGRMVRYLAEEASRQKKAGVIIAVDHFRANTKQLAHDLGRPIDGETSWKAFLSYCGDIPSIIPIKEWINAGASRFRDQSFDFMFLDGSHEAQAVYNDLKTWWPKLKAGGVVAGNAFRMKEWPGVEEGVCSFCKQDQAWVPHYNNIFILGKDSKNKVTNQLPLAFNKFLNPTLSFNDAASVDPVEPA